MRRPLQQRELMTATTPAPIRAALTHNHTCEGNRERWERAKKAHAKLLTLTCRNKREGSPQSKAKNMKLAYYFRRCRPFCFVHFTSRSPPTLTDEWQNEMK